MPAYSVHPRVQRARRRREDGGRLGSLLHPHASPLAGATLDEGEALELWPPVHERYAESFGVDPAIGRQAFAQHPASVTAGGSRRSARLLPLAAQDRVAVRALVLLRFERQGRAGALPSVGRRLGHVRSAEAPLLGVLVGADPEGTVGRGQ